MAGNTDLVLSPLSGRGVAVAVIDTGINVDDPAFKNPDGSTRILRLWDQNTDIYYDSAAINEEIAKKIDKAVFPGLQGGGLQHIIAAKAVTFGEALKPEFKTYMEQVVKNAKALAQALQDLGFNVLTGGTDNHLILLDLRNKGITGLELEQRLANVHIITNKNAVPFDTEKKTVTSGIRLGTPAVTSRGLKEEDMKVIAELILDCLVTEYYNSNIDDIKAKVQEICDKYPLY